MSDWTERPLEQLAEITSGGTPSRTNPSFWNGEIPWVTPSDITSSKSNYIFDTKDAITESGIRSSSAKLLPEGALLLTSRATIGEIKIAARPVTTNQGFKNIVSKSQIDGKFLFYQLSRMKGSFERFAAGSTFLEINRKDTGRVMIPLPQKKEVQCRIAQVLETIDKAIEKTESLIEKYQQIKAGLMHDLFTRGIGPDGKLRPPREEAPELYQETPIGWIPKDWAVATLSELCVGGLTNGVFKEPRRVGEGVPLVNVADLYRGDSIDLDSCERFDASMEELARYGAQEQELFFTRSSLKLEGIAQVNWIESASEPAVFECHVMRLRPDISKISPKILKDWCQWVVAKRHFMANAKQVTMTTISQGGIFNLRCPLIPMREQKEIVAKVQAVEGRLVSESTVLEKLRCEKRGLMNDLLSGEVTVQAAVNDEAANV